MKYGFVYIWKEINLQKFYIGSHWGDTNDGYICSSASMRKQHERHPKRFKRKIIAYVYTNRQDLLKEEQRWLDMIKPEEFGMKYYNVNAKTHMYYWWMNEKTKKQVSKKISIATKKAMQQPDIKKRSKEAIRLYPNGKPNQSKAMKRWWANKKNKQHMISAQKAGITEQTRQRHREVMQKRLNQGLSAFLPKSK